MYNTDLPRRAELPTSAQLKRSTWIAGIAATAILTLVVLPSEYAVDPTGVGRLLGLTQMGEIKTQLAEEAALDAANTAATPQPGAAADPALTARLDRIEQLLRGLAEPANVGAITQPAAVDQTIETAARSETVATAGASTDQAPDEERFAVTSGEPNTSGWQDELTIELSPGEGAEVKLVMEEGAQANFHWTANGSVVNYDTHGDGGGNSISYEKGRSVPEQEGVLEAAFTGNHGWFWRNRSDEPLTLTLRTRGGYSEVKRAL